MSLYSIVFDQLLADMTVGRSCREPRLVISFLAYCGMIVFDEFIADGNATLTERQGDHRAVATRGEKQFSIVMSAQQSP